MPSQRFSAAFAAGATNDNILAGSIYEFMSRPTRVIVAAASDVVDSEIGVNFGARTMCQSANTTIPLEPGGVAGAGPDIPQQVVVDDIALPGERIVVSVRAVTASAGVRVLTQFTEVG